MVGNVGVGGANPIRIQSMITADTRDTEACVKEVLELAEAGCEIVRITAQTRKYAENLEHIRDGVRKAGCGVPLDQREGREKPAAQDGRRQPESAIRPSAPKP